MSKSRRPPKLKAEHRQELSAIVEANRTATLEEIQLELERRTGLRAHEQTLISALQAAGWTRVRDGSTVQVERSEDDRCPPGKCEARGG